MTSEERRAARRERRIKRRNEKRDRALAQYDSLERVAEVSSLVSAYRKARCGVSWKESVQRYGMNLLRNAAATRRDILAGKDVRKGFVEFDIMERGKLRHIKSVHISERVAQRSLCENALIPVLTRSLICDNGASLKGKGISFAIDRLTEHLRRHYRKHGTEGYVLIMDFKSYFESIDHERVKQILSRSFKDQRLIEFAMGFVHAFGDRGLGLGSEASQILAVAYPSRIDHYIKEQMRIKGYGRYMDDLYLLHESKDYLKQCLSTLRLMFARIGITLSEKKTRVVKLSRGFVFLKTRFVLTGTGKVVRKPSQDSIVRQRRKLKKFKRFLDKGEMTLAQTENSYMSWRGCISHKNAHMAVRNMDRLYKTLFPGGTAQWQH